MPNKMKKESNGPGILITFSGTVKGEEMKKLRDSIKSDKVLSKLSYQIWDFSKIKDIKLTFDELRSYAMNDSVNVRKNPHKKIALIVRKIAPSGLDTMYHAYEKAWGGYESKTFTDIDSARKWVQNG